MDISNNIVPDNYHTVIEIGACDIHTFTNKTKSIVALGILCFYWKVLAKSWEHIYKMKHQIIQILTT